MQNKGLVKLFALLFGLVSIYQLSFTFKANQIEELFREQKMLKQLDHQNMIKLHHAFRVQQEICLIMEYARGGTLDDYMKANE